MGSSSERGSWGEAAQELAAALRRDAPLPSGALRRLLVAVEGEPPAGVWHPTGFVVLTLHADGRGALRLHLWPEGARELGAPCWPVHDHAWHLRSHVLHGEVRSHGYRVDDDPAGDWRLYAVDYAPGRRSCMRRSDRRVSVRPEGPRRVPAGERYAVAAGCFHASRVEAGESAATLVVTTITARAHPWVVGPDDGPEAVPVERPEADAGLVRGVLGQVTAALP
ncbi:MAG: hypothetical protein KDK70_10970 [Myxococcales bacterium]|nr:hypothetical protein [Myxococcales bacterium]